jgi:mycofactocin system FadH/OYE family oxidoreductase 1
MRLLEPVELAGRTAPNRVLFGPIVTNLGDDERRFTERHTAFYERRARGGCGIIVVEGASVHPSDWPYERAPLAERCGAGWRAIADACHAHGSLVLASLDHAGGQGSSAYSQRELWAPSRVPEVNSREVPKWMEADDIAAVVAGFADAARIAVEAGCDGVEVNAGQHSLVRQFLSGLTNQRGDEWGTDRLRFARDVLAAVRAAVGDAIVSLRLSCDELAPWAGITPEAAPDIAAELVGVDGTRVDLVVVTRGAIFSVGETRPDHHAPADVNQELCRSVRNRCTESGVGALVCLQGSVVDPQHADAAITDGVCDVVEMTRAQLADPDLVVKTAAGRAVRPCIRCNQTCQVRDARNPIITCVGEPSTGHEADDPDWYQPGAGSVLVVGGGPAGLEAARVAATRGLGVRLVERDAQVGGLAGTTGPAGPLVAWLADECARLGVDITTGTELTEGDIAAATAAGTTVIACTGSRRGLPEFRIDPDVDHLVIDVVDVRRGRELPDGVIVLHDPIGGPIAVALAEELGGRAVLVTHDQIAGNELARSGDLAPANVRLARAGVRVERRAVLRSVRAAPAGAAVPGVAVPGVAVTVQDRFSGEVRTIEAAALVDCGFRLPADDLGAPLAAGDCVAPRTVLEAVLEGRRAALAATISRTADAVSGRLGA